MQEQVRRKILLIDDDTNLLVTLSDFLLFEGYEVVTADSGEKGLQRLADMTPDLIILDMSMPGMGGVGFLEAISTSEGRLQHPVLVLTARGNMAEFFANVAVDGFVAKPCDPQDLLMEVGRIIFLRSGETSESAALRKAEKKRILVGEDDAATREMLTKAFIGAGYLVDTQIRGPEMLEKAIVDRPDLVVIKLLLPVMNGDAVASVLKEMPNTKNIPIVLYSAGAPAGAEERFAGEGTGVSQFVGSSDPGRLLAAARESLESARGSLRSA